MELSISIVLGNPPQCGRRPQKVLASLPGATRVQAEQPARQREQHVRRSSEGGVHFAQLIRGAVTAPTGGAAGGHVCGAGKR